MSEHLPPTPEVPKSLSPMRTFGENQLVTSLQDAAHYLQVHPNTLRRWADKGIVPIVILPSGVRRYPISAIEQLRRQMYQAFEEENTTVQTQKESEVVSMASLLLNDPRMNLNESVSLILKALETGKEPGEVAEELGVDELKVQRVIEIGSKLMERLT